MSWVSILRSGVKCLTKRLEGRLYPSCPRSSSITPSLPREDHLGGREQSSPEPEHPGAVILDSLDCSTMREYISSLCKGCSLQGFAVGTQRGQSRLSHRKACFWLSCPQHPQEHSPPSLFSLLLGLQAPVLVSPPLSILLVLLHAYDSRPQGRFCGCSHSPREVIDLPRGPLLPFQPLLTLGRNNWCQ